MDELLRDFLVETAEHIEAASSQLVQLERDPNDREMVASIFRLLHTIKGTCGFLGLARLAKLSHATEELIGAVRGGAQTTSDTVTLILSAIDRIRFILAEIERLTHEPDGDDQDLIGELKAHAATQGSATDANVPAPDMLTPAAMARAAIINEPLDNSRNPPADTIRVAVGAIEHMMMLVSELVLTRNQLTEVTRTNTDEPTKGALQRLSAVATDLQDAVMRARMQPMRRIFSTLPRLVRELAASLNKKIDIVVEGDETELDRQLIELIRDPLTHMIRNCADHGLESSAVRVAAGKPEMGLIRVSAAQEAGQITIEVVDDGRGLDVERIRIKAASLGLASGDDIAAMADEDAARFIFAPGFSTAQAVTDISGRGVGLDVVRENIEAIGGTVAVSSSVGAGTRFTIRIPLTLAIAPSLVLTSRGVRFALPQLSVVEAVALGPDSAHSIEMIQGSMILRLRDQVLPVIDLGALLNPSSDAPTPDSDEQLVLVMRVASLAFGMIVSSVDDVQEIVVKPLGSALSHLKIYSGHTILGDGSVVLILDPAGIAAELGLRRDMQYRATAPEVRAQKTSDTTRIALFRAGVGPLKALPLSLITRIETFLGTDIEPVGDGYVIRHGDELLPLLPLAAGLRPREGEQPVLIIGVGGEAMGLLVEEIVDIVEEKLDIQIIQNTPGMLGSAIVGDAVVEVADITHFMRIARPEAMERGVNRRFHVLLVDDRQFFRDLLGPVIAAAGYSVVTLGSAADALAMIEAGERFDAIVTDLDMPDMDGYAFARALRALPRTQAVPVIALAPRTDERSAAAAVSSGIHSLCGKFDRWALVKALTNVLEPASLVDHAIEDRALSGEAA